MQTSMGSYPRAAVERAMKIQEVILRAIAKKITWFQAAEVAGLTPRHMRRLRWRYENLGYDGLLQILLAAEIPFGGKHGRVTQQELNLFQLAAVYMAHTSGLHAAFSSIEASLHV
jgi:hypothetical protein